jgi:hypothetical protein
MSDTENPIQDLDTSEHPQTNPDNPIDARQNLAAPPVRAINIDSAPPTPPPSEEQKAKDYRTEKREQNRFVVECIVAFFVTVYTVVSICLWIATKRANEISRQGVADADRNFKRDERAWMAFEFVGGNVTFTIDKPFLIPTKTLNSGKTPAKNVRGNVVVGVFKKGEPLDFDYTPGHRNANYRIEAGTIFPNGFIDESFQGMRTGKNGMAEAILLHKPLWEEIRTGQSFIIVHGKITYQDVFGTEHWTTYCRYVTNPSFISDECTRFNDTDDNELGLRCHTASMARSA